MHLNCENVVNSGDQNLPPGISPVPACQPVTRTVKPASRRFAVASATIGGLGVAVYFILALAALAMTASTNRDSLAGLVAGVGATLNVLPFAILIFLANCLGLVLGGVALCREDGRELGVLGLLLNTFPVPVFLGFLANLLPQPH